MSVRVGGEGRFGWRRREVCGRVGGGEAWVTCGTTGSTSVASVTAHEQSAQQRTIERSSRTVRTLQLLQTACVEARTRESA